MGHTISGQRSANEEELGPEENNYSKSGKLTSLSTIAKQLITCSHIPPEAEKIFVWIIFAHVEFKMLTFWVFIKKRNM